MNVVRMWVLPPPQVLQVKLLPSEVEKNQNKSIWLFVREKHNKITSTLLKKPIV